MRSKPLDVFYLSFGYQAPLPDCPDCGQVSPGIGFAIQDSGQVFTWSGCSCGVFAGELIKPSVFVSEAFERLGFDLSAFANDQPFQADLCLTVGEFCQGRKALERIPKGSSVQ